MPSSFHGLSLTSQALRSFQRALDVTGHNIANVNTPGYSRQTVDFLPLDPSQFFMGGGHWLGNGVTVGSVNRIRDLFLEARRMAAGAELGRNGVLSSALRQVESLFTEAEGGGISSALSSFFNAWSGLAASPSDSAARLQVQVSGQTLADRVRSRYADLQALGAQLDEQVQGTFIQIDLLSQRIGELNASIREQSQAGGAPNDLLDERDMAIRELGSLIGITARTYEDGSVAVYASSMTLVDAAGSRPIPRNVDAAAMTLTDGSWTHQARGGQLAGLLQARTAVSNRQDELDLLANTLRSEINALHLTGTNRLGESGVAFFNDSSPQTGARDFDLDPRPQSSPDAIAAGTSGAAGDGALALALANLREASMAGIGNKSFAGYYGELVSSVGADSAHYRAAYATQAGIVDQIEAQIQSIGGVSLDDEMANMMRLQRSYQAAAKALSVLDQVTEDLIGMIRR